MPAPLKYPDELRERALRLVEEAMAQEPQRSLNAAVLRIGQRVGIVPDTLRGWAKQRGVDTGKQPGTTSDDAARIKELERANRELKRANEILLAASSFFARQTCSTANPIRSTVPTDLTAIDRSAAVVGVGMSHDNKPHVACHRHHTDRAR